MIWVSSCFSFLLAIALIGVGAAFIRKARPTSGYLFVAAGALELLMRCCRFGADPERLLGSSLDYDMVNFAILSVRLGGVFEWFLVGILITVALVGLARDLRATEPAS